MIATCGARLTFRPFLQLLFLALALWPFIGCCKTRPPATADDRKIGKLPRPSRSVERAQAAIDRAEALIEESAAVPAQLREENLQEADKLLSQVERTKGAGDLRLVAANNRGALLIDRGKPRDAIVVFNRITDEMNTPEFREGRPTFLYNWGRALEDTGRAEVAVPLYREAVTLDPRFEAAADEALLVARNLSAGEVGLEEIARLVSILIEQGNFSKAGQILRQGLVEERWVGLPSHELLLTELVRYFTAASLEPSDLTEEWQPLLKGLLPKLAPDQRASVESLIAAPAAPLSLEIAPGEPGRESQGWQEPPGKAQIFSRFLKELGDGHLRARRPALAAQRYAAAWNLDPRNVEAALYLAETIDKESETLDPQRSLRDKIVSKTTGVMVESLFGEDWEAQLYFRTVLGESLLRQRRYADSIAQYNLALQAHERLALKRQSPVKPVPVLQTSLAAAYKGQQDLAQAWYHHALAAQGHLIRDESCEALAALGQADKTGYSPTPSQIHWFENVRQQAQAKCTTVPVTDYPPTVDCPQTPSEPAQERGAQHLFTISFHTDEWTLDREDLKILDQVAALVSKDRAAQLEIAGYADATGEERYNVELAFRRSQAVWSHLLAREVPLASMVLLSHGEAQARGGANAADRQVVVMVQESP